LVKRINWRKDAGKCLADEMMKSSAALKGYYGD
jgi:hypothetical protein